MKPGDLVHVCWNGCNSMLALGLLIEVHDPLPGRRKYKHSAGPLCSILMQSGHVARLRSQFVRPLEEAP